MPKPKQTHVPSCPTNGERKCIWAQIPPRRNNTPLLFLLLSSPMMTLTLGHGFFALGTLSHSASIGTVPCIPTTLPTPTLRLRSRVRFVFPEVTNEEILKCGYVIKSVSCGVMQKELMGLREGS
jgi:hypothetical protein